MVNQLLVKLLKYQPTVNAWKLHLAPNPLTWKCKNSKFQVMMLTFLLLNKSTTSKMLLLIVLRVSTMHIYNLLVTTLNRNFWLLETIVNAGISMPLALTLNLLNANLSSILLFTIVMLYTNTTSKD